MSTVFYLFSTSHIKDIMHMFFDLLQAIAIPPNIFYVHRSLNLLSQFWIHSNIVPYLGPLEYFINTPSSHRVHHGRNPYCIDKNYGGVLIIWDRLFGTYEPERKEEEIAYGLVTPVGSFNQMWFLRIKVIGYDKGQMRNEKNEELFPGTWNKVGAALWPPAYFPGMRTKQFFLWFCMEDSTEGVPEVERLPTVRYNPPLSDAIRYYLLAQWVFLIHCFLQFNMLRTFLGWTEFLCRLSFLIAYIQMFGYYFDHSRFSWVFDSSRLSLSILLGVFLRDSLMVVYGCTSLAIVFWLASAGQISMTHTVSN
ncbi:fatty acid hydroxylase family protein, partial [Cooperia oncophora]